MKQSSLGDSNFFFKLKKKKKFCLQRPQWANINRHHLISFSSTWTSIGATKYNLMIQCNIGHSMHPVYSLMRLIAIDCHGKFIAYNYTLQVSTWFKSIGNKQESYYGSEKRLQCAWLFGISERWYSLDISVHKPGESMATSDIIYNDLL